MAIIPGILAFAIFQRWYMKGLAGRHAEVLDTAIVQGPVVIVRAPEELMEASAMWEDQIVAEVRRCATTHTGPVQ